MPTDLTDYDAGGIELWFANDLEGESFYLRDSSVYTAEQVRAEEDSAEMPKYGDWLPVHEASPDGQSHRSGWIVAVSELVEELQMMDLNPVENVWVVTRCEKSGVEQTDPYEVNVELPNVEQNQDRL